MLSLLMFVAAAAMLTSGIVSRNPLMAFAGVCMAVALVMRLLAPKPDRRR